MLALLRGSKKGHSPPAPDEGGRAGANASVCSSDVCHVAIEDGGLDMENRV